MPASSSKYPPPDPLLEDSDPEDDSSEDVTEDEDGVDLTPALDAAILRTLGKIRRGEGVYGEENVLQDAMREAEAEASRKGIKGPSVRGTADKPYRLADYHREALLAGRDLRDPEQEQQEPLTYVEGERRMRNEAVSAFTAFAAEEEDEEEEGFVPVKRSAGPEESDDEDEEYRKFLLDMGGGEAKVRDVLGVHETDVHEASAPQDGVKEGKEDKKKKRKEKKAKQDDDFLMNYILNRGWIEKDTQAVPTYDEITAPKTKSAAGVNGEGEAGPSHPWGTLEDEEAFDDQADAFEAAYNFRFEEPGSSNIVSHPRSFPSLVRRPDDARAVKRAAAAERKAAAKAAYEETLRAEKGKKRREMEKRLESLRKDVGGKMDWGEVEKLMEGDYDEEQWDEVVGRMMEAMDEGEDEDGKPVWDDDDDFGMDEEEDEFEERPDIPLYEEEEEDEGPINMDADFEDIPMPKKSKNNKKGKHRDPSPELPEEEINLSVPDKAAKVKQAIREYQSLDHEDTIGDLPTRFKYTKGQSTDFGLTPVEILLATDAELNGLMSVKHIAPYRQGGLGASGKGLGKKVRDLKEELRKRRWGEEYVPEKPQDAGEERRRWLEKHRANGGAAPKRKREEGTEGEGRPGKRKGRKERRAAKAQEGAVGAPTGDAQRTNAPAAWANGDGSGEPAKKRRKKKKHAAEAAA